ncbi:MAG TPA: GHMP kinase [Myxococcota bacterium]|nr:GHMP kinase [Myxococcota bacterium]
MIVTQTPLRVSLAGGATDLAAYYEEHEGFVVSTAIDKFAFVIVKERFDDEVYLNYMRKEIVSSVDAIQHELIREAMRITGVDRGVEVTLLSDIPSEGSGLGSSSSFSVGLLNAFYAYRGEQVTAERLAREACEIEIERLGKPIGKQDQYIAAYGGLRALRFRRDGEVDVRSLRLAPSDLRDISSRLHLYFTGRTRRAESILSEQRARTQDRRAELDGIKALALELEEALEARELDRLGEVLHESWELKRRLASGISDGPIEQLYAQARSHGALGGKICGAGGGGFLLVDCPPEHGQRLAKGMASHRELPFRLERDGSKVIFNYRREAWR